MAEVAKNYYCDGECYHCCWVPGGGIGGGDGACHTSFDTSEGPVVNCNPGVYGPGTVGVGPALVIGDSLGLGICVGGVQQVCNHIAQCNGAGSSAGPGGTGPAATSAAKSLVPKGDPASTGEPPNENMSSLQALYLHIQSLESAMRRSFFANERATPARTRRKAYVDFITARGTVNWTRILREIEPYNREYDVFAVTDSSGVVLPAASYHQGILYHANLAFVGAVPHLVDRIGYVESRYWTDEEKNDYLDGIDPEAELRKTMSPMAFEALKSVPIQDWRLLAQVAPNEPEIPYRTYDGFRLGRAPIVTAAQDCVGESEVTLAVALEDPEESNQEDSAYPVIIDWGDGTVSRHTFDSSLATNAYSHSYADAGTFVAYVTAANSTGLRGVAGVVVEAEGGSPDSSRPSIATVALDDVRVYSPAVSLGGDLSFEVRAAQTNGQGEGIGWSDLLTLANAGPNLFGDIVGYNESLVPFDTVVLRPFHMGGSYLDSVYLQVPSMTLGFYDPRAGAIVSQTIPLTEEMLRVYYEGATAPVPVGELERDVNGELIVPVLRTNDNLAADFCGGDPCERVDRIEIDLTPEIMGTRPAVPPGLFEDLRPGDAARWVEDVPNVFLASPEPSTNDVSGACATTVSPNHVVADEPVSSLVRALTVVPNAPVVSVGSPVQLQATATLLDGSTLDVTQHATWTVDDETVLTVSNRADKGLLSPSTIPGTTAVVAALGGATAQAMATHDAPARGYRSYRFHFDAVHGGAGKASISGVELFVDGRLLESLMESEDSGTIGPFPAVVSSSEGNDPTYAFDVSRATVWSSADGTFALDEPYAVGDSPVY
ncbi:MAG: Ig-like domain-containing protein, partial [Polyangiales bacterium]